MKRCQRSSFTSSGTGAARFVGGGALDRLVLEAADAREPRLLQPVEQDREVRLRLAGEADDEGGADGKVGHRRAPALQPLQRLLLVRGPAHRLEHGRRGMLEGDVEVGEDLALRHQRQHVVDVRVGVDVVQAHPGAESPSSRHRSRKRALTARPFQALSAYLMSRP